MNVNSETVARRISVLDLACLLLISVSFSSMSLLCLKRFNPGWAIAIALALFATFGFLQRDKVTWGHFQIKWDLVGLIVFASLLRMTPSHFVTGGQDQGIYVITSALIERIGSTATVDSVREKFREYGLQEYYDRYNRLKKAKDYVQGKYEGIARPGVYYLDQTKSDIQFQFYHLHPAWMSIFGRLFGDSNRVMTLGFFGVLSIVFFYLISFEISGGRRSIAFLVGLFLTVNPAHIYFSRYPLTEVMALALTSGAVYYLIRAYRHGTNLATSAMYLWLSSGLFACYFLTRVSGFIWMPFVFAVWGLVGIYEQSADVFRKWTVWWFTVLIAYGASLLYGYFYSFPYFYDIHRSFFGFLRNLSTLFVVAVTFIAILVYTIAVLGARRFLNEKVEFKEKLTCGLRYLALGLVVVALGMNLYAAHSLWRFPISEMIDSDRRIWLSGLSQWEALKTSSIYVLQDLLSPILFLSFLASVYVLFKSRSALAGMLLFVLSFSWIYAGYFQDFVAFQYYCLRYQIMELIPFTILAAVTFVGWGLYSVGWKRWVSAAVLFVVFAHSVARSAPLFKGGEMQGVADSLQDLVKAFEKDDLVLVIKPASPFMDIVSSMIYYYDRTLAVIGDGADIDTVLRQMLLDYPRRVFVIAPWELDDQMNFFLRRTKRVQLKGMKLEATRWAPRKYLKYTQDWFVYEINKDKLGSGLVFSRKHSTKWSLTAGSKLEFVRESRLKIPNDRPWGLVIDLKSDLGSCRFNRQLWATVGSSTARAKTGDGADQILFPLDSGVSEVGRIDVTGIGKEQIECIDSIYFRSTIFQLYPAPYPREIEVGGFHPDEVWTNGEGTFVGEFSLKGEFHHLVINTRGWNPFLRPELKALGFTDLNPEVEIDGNPIRYVRHAGTSLYFEFPAGLERFSKLAVRSNTFIPAKTGLGEDVRALGLDIESIVLY